MEKQTIGELAGVTGKDEFESLITVATKTFSFYLTIIM